jgi:ATP-dependent DNA ligase
MFTGRGCDLADKFPLIREAVVGLRPSGLILNGEAVCCDDEGVANFERIVENCRVY